MGVEMDILLLWDNKHQFTELLKKMSICKIFIINSSSSFRDIYNPLNIFKMKKIMRDYNIIHVHLFPAQYFAVLANRFNSKKSKLIFTEHSTSNSRISNPFFQIIDRFFYGDYEKIICISEEIKIIYKTYLRSGNQGRLSLIPNGIDIDKYKNAKPLLKSAIHTEIKDDDKLIIQVSAFRSEKDQDTLIKSIALLSCNYKLLLVGDGKRKLQLINLVNDLGLEKRVFFLGQRMDVAQILKQVDIAVLSSHWEGFGLVSVEAMASGTPLVASDVPGLRDVVKDAGLLFKTGDYIRLSEIIKTLTEDPDYARSIAKKGYERALQFDIHKMVQKHIELYQEVDSQNK